MGGEKMFNIFLIFVYDYICFVLGFEFFDIEWVKILYVEYFILIVDINIES